MTRQRKPDQFRGVGEMVANRPLAVAVTCGHRTSDTGKIVNTDRFYLMRPPARHKKFKSESGKEWGAQGRSQHPDFLLWNQEADKGTPGHSTLYGNLIHYRIEDAWSYFRHAYMLGHPTGDGDPPGGGTWARAGHGGPNCTGDGTRASRFQRMDDGRPVYEDIGCPGDLCHFAKWIGGTTICGFRGALYFQLRWPGREDQFPALQTRWETKGRESVANCQGLIEEVIDFGKALGIEAPSLFVQS